MVKIGTATISGADGRPDPTFLASIAQQVVGLRAAGLDVILVTSGAIGTGRALLGLRERPKEVRLRQACAAIGQPRLMHAWEEAFAPHGMLVSQLLLTRHTFTDRKSFLNLRNATEALLELGVLPVANENDTVSVEEIDATFGDNDRLSAYIATKVEADLLVILSDVAGLFSAPPGTRGAVLVPVVPVISAEVARMASGKTGSGAGRGGMASKLESAKVATSAGIPVVIASGREADVLTRLILRGESIGTQFLASGVRRGKERWLEIARASGRVLVDAGAARALRDGAHLLPAGVTGVEGSFAAGGVVDIVARDRVVARAVSMLSSKELELVVGLRSDEARRALGRSGAVNVTRKYNVVLLDRA